MAADDEAKDQRSGSSGPAAAAERQLVAYNARDLEAFLAAYHEDCVVRTHPAGDVLLAGRAAMRDRYGALFRDHPALHCELLARIVHERFAIDHEQVHGLRDGGPVFAVAIYEVEDDLIVNAWFLRARVPAAA